jgi:hypothetical protein
MEPYQTLQTILLGGLSAGMLDITAACINSAIRAGRTPLYVLQSVAGGWLGAKTFEGGYPSAALGILTHFFIATMAATVYIIASQKLPFLTRQPVICGILYGIAVYAVMYMVVLPLSAYQFKFFNQPGVNILIGVLIHIFCVGLPIALVARWRATLAVE